MAEVFLRRLTRWQAEQQRGTVADVYVECHGADRAGFLARFERHVQERDFDMVSADSAAGLVGCLYGFRPEPGGELFESVRGVLPAEAAGAAAMGRLFLLVELMVRGGRRREGVATRMRDLLLARHGVDVVVGVMGNGGSYEVLRAWSCTKLGSIGTPPREAWLFPPHP
ncbi:hypothetical protein [Streptomyces sp. NPDC059063]|uniref:hypothetical protein n=1 Tax=unclassified Streptomyces TaxID=2593676 RepID=UPI00367F1E56